MLKYCTYSSIHPSGFFYLGKGITSRVVSGAYKGSGTRFKLVTLFSAEFSEINWVTTVLGTYATEEEAYAAELLLVPIELLKNPFCLNDTEGGRRGRYRTRSTLLKSIQSEKKKITRATARMKIAELKKKLKEKK